ncbi:MAG: SagB/ThcOx family dehydrogenase [Betaproteobacteria bacterium]|nr:SagB/ThcOx family dehydrogenase [Betaproteobacteria bacterium]
MTLEAGTDPQAGRIAAIVAYHQRSKHHLRRYAPGPGELDWANQPDPFRTFEGAPVVELPLAADTLRESFDTVSRGRGVALRPLDRESLAILFELSLGISAWKAYGASRWALRCNPSSGNLHPTEGYLVCPDLAGLAGGVHHYVSRDHALERRATPAEAQWMRAFPAGGVIIGLASIHWREAWKYGMRAYRYCQHDCGHAIAALAYAAACLGWRAFLLDGWGDDDISALLGLDRADDFADAEREAPDVLLWVGSRAADPRPQELLRAIEGARWQGRANRLSLARVAWRDIEIAEQAARKPRTAGMAHGAPSPLPQPRDAACGMPAAALIRQRRSAVGFDGVTTITAQAFFTMLDALLPRAGLPPWDAFATLPLAHPALFVHRVTGLAPGLYLLLRDPAVLPLARQALPRDWLWQRVPGCPEHVPLHLLAHCDTREVAKLIACHQDIAADSCFALGFLAQFDAPLAGGAWVYRHLFWETGVLGQVLYLEAEAAGVRATGIGCFFDDEMHRLLGAAAAHWQSLYHFTVGGALDDPRLTTYPPYAHLRR